MSHHHTRGCLHRVCERTLVGKTETSMCLHQHSKYLHRMSHKLRPHSSSLKPLPSKPSQFHRCECGMSLEPHSTKARQHLCTSSLRKRARSCHSKALVLCLKSMCMLGTCYPYHSTSLLASWCNLRHRRIYFQRLPNAANLSGNQTSCTFLPQHSMHLCPNECNFHLDMQFLRLSIEVRRSKGKHMNCTWPAHRSTCPCPMART